MKITSGAAILGVLVWSLGGPHPAAAGTALTNYEFVRDTAHDVCVQLAGALGTHTERRVAALRSATSAGGNFLVETTLTKALQEGGWQVLASADSTTPAVVEFEVVDLGLSYERTYRNSWLGEKRVVREARARVFARLLDKDLGSIVWADQAESRKRNEVSAAQLPLLEEKNPADYVKATLPPPRWNHIVEPVVVTGIIAGLIFLFFSNQNTN